MLQVFFIILLALSFAFCRYEIVFDIDNSPPPIIPLDPEDYIFTVPMNQMISKPLIIYIQFENGSRVTQGKMGSETYELSTIDQKTAHAPNRFTDKWATSGGELCQKSAWWLNYPQRLNRVHYKNRCGTTDGSATTLLVRAFEGTIIVDWLYHKHDVIPLNTRVFRCQYRNQRLKADSYGFRVTAPAHHLTITQQPPKSVEANHDFTIVAEVRYANDSIVDSGLDSVVNVDITIPYYRKVFNNVLSRRMQLKTTSLRLAGLDTILHQGNYDWVIRKRAVKGRVSFKNIRILDHTRSVKLNLTMTMIRDPWLRVPTCDTCYADLEQTKFTKNNTEVEFSEPDIYLLNKLQAVKFTDPFEVTEQKIHKLVFSKETHHFFEKYKNPKTKLFPIIRNIEIPGFLTVQANDNSGRRIFAGKDSDFSLEYKTSPCPGTCICSDATRRISGGYNELSVSVCQIIENITIEIIPSNLATASIFTPSFVVEGDLNVAHFGDFRFSGGGARIQSHVNSFIRFAALDINNGHMVPNLKKEGFVFNVRTYETESSTEEAYRAVVKMEHHILPKNKPRLIISSTTEAITLAINPELWQIGAAFISTSNTAPIFSDKEKYPFFNRVCWADIETFKSVLYACKDRMWTELLILKEEDAHFSEIYYHTAEQAGIEILDHISVNPSPFTTGEISHLKPEMDRLKSFGTKVILLIADERNQPFILRAAQLAGLDSLHGYQWILYGKYAWKFPFGNEGVCRLGIPCTKAFTSAYLFSKTYNISGYHTKDWVRVLGYYFAVDRYKYKGSMIRYRPPEVGGKIALGYDAVLLYAHVVNKLISERRTVKPLEVSKLCRSTTVDNRLIIKGLTGNIQLNGNGDRIGYFGFLAQINPLHPEEMDAPKRNMVSFTRSFIRKENGSQLEIPYKSRRSGIGPNLESKAVLPNSTKYNVRTYASVSGLVNPTTQSISRNPPEPWPSQSFKRTEELAPIFHCDFPCGKHILSPQDVNVYDTGTCEAGKKCHCNEGFHGNFCELITCTCDYGVCYSINRCNCHHGWKGKECNIAICDECINGKCVEPDRCECNSPVYIGPACETHLAAILAPLILGSALIIGIIVLLIKYILKHAERNAALSNTDWIVEWPYVTQCVQDDGTTSRTSVGDKSSLISKRAIHTYVWKNEKWFGKAISSKTIDPRIPDMRLEMVELVKIRHRNLIIYGGACLSSPNVSLFLEVADKGSLNDILLNESIDLGWEFKWSFMKDICAGMKFLHEKTNVVSHGRLKSHNCLIDSRWTVRISGFGAYIIRFGKFRLANESKEDVKNLFWTAPELLENVASLDDVKKGTPAGDTYSFTIILTEILTRAEPYNYELESISEKAIYDMITENPSRESKHAQKAWEEIGGASMFQCRPIIRDEFLPESVLQKKQFLKMLEDAWNENPSARMSFDKLVSLLNQIHPSKGELIDNLINLLESYSTNLEVIVVDRTKELEVSKARAEQLLSQMLPRKVCAELKLGKKIPPEVFPTATIFFSDIVDFALICQDSSPFQIVDFLNETYNAFDEVLDFYDVYKVETISDSYMVVSGVPERNGIQHASFIATMALDLMSTVTTFVIPHKPKATLQLRVGINSGPVVAGVVGMLMPRYCLFGDTVNTASRMESSSQALCIQVSDSTAAILDEIGGFELESRGPREVKGRGLMTTFWLWGKDDFDKPLPDQSLALSLSQHKFK